mgnify:CR=1 FL=1
MSSQRLQIYFLLLFTFIPLIYSENNQVFLKPMKIHFNGQEYSTPGFFLDSTEVSNKDYLNFIKKTGVKKPLSLRIDSQQDPTKPAAGMDWYDASLYCKVIGKRLPTYIELIRASQGEILRRYPFGNIAPEFSQAPFQTLSFKPTTTFAVTDFKEFGTPEGILNLAGNVREWTDEVSSDESPGDMISTDVRRVYGGSYASSFKEVKVGTFQWVEMGGIIRDVGFRCARDIEDGYMISDSASINPEVLKGMVYGHQASKEDLLRISTSKAVEKIRESQSERDAKKLSDLLYDQSMNLLRERELLVSDQVDLEDEELVGIPFGLSWIGAPEPMMVYQDRFDIEKKLVTNNQFKTYLENSSTKPNLPPNHLPGEGLKPARATWHDARSYCRAKNMDLPSEVQWEKAVRGPDEQAKLRFTPQGKSRGYYDIFEVVDGPAEWLRDSWTTSFPAPNKDTLPVNPVGKYSLLRALKGRGNLPDSFATVSSRRAS